MAQTAARTAPSGHDRMQQIRPQRLPFTEPAANDAAAPAEVAAAEPERLWRQWPLAIIVAGLALSVAWFGLIVWGLVYGLSRLAG